MSASGIATLARAQAGEERTRRDGPV